MADETKVAEEVQPTAEFDYKAAYEDQQKELERFKNAVTKANAEVSRVKKELADRMTAEEKAEALRKEQAEANEGELNELRAEKRITGYRDKLMAGGYDSESALIMAKALPPEVPDTYFETMKQSHEASLAKARADALNNQPKPTAGGVLAPADDTLERMLKGAGLK